MLGATPNAEAASHGTQPSAFDIAGFRAAWNSAAASNTSLQAESAASLSSVSDSEGMRALISTLGLPADRYCSKLLAIGWPAGRPLVAIENPDRRRADDVVHWERW